MNFTPIKVLLVEDNPGDARLLSELLREADGAGFRLTHLDRLRDALERLGEEHFDIILLDLSLSDEQGFDTIRRVREQSPELPIVVLTGLNDDEMAIKAVRAGAQDYLVKGEASGSLLARSMRYAIERMKADRQLKLQFQRIFALREITVATTSTLNVQSVLKVLMEKIDLLLPYTAVQVWLMNRESGEMERAACWNLDEEEWKSRKLTQTPSLIRLAISSRKPVLARNIQTDRRILNRDFYRRHGLVSYLGVPLLVKGEVAGILAFLTREEHHFTDEEIEFLSTLGSQVAIAIHNCQLYDEMAKLAAQLERSNKVKDEFLGVMSHELRTPLNVVIGYAGMIQDGTLGEINSAQGKALETVISRTRDQLIMINSILQATQIQADDAKAENHELDLQRFLDDLKTSYAIPMDKDLALRWDYPSSLPVVETDGEKLRHILQNLINNAIKFTDKGAVTLSACHKAEANTVEFKVTDTGGGIPAEFLHVIFDKFRQVNGSEMRRHSGVGMGLYIVKKFTELLGGTVEVGSEVGKGSTFTVSIPCVMSPSLREERRDAGCGGSDRQKPTDRSSSGAAAHSPKI